MKRRKLDGNAIKKNDDIPSLQPDDLTKKERSSKTKDKKKDAVWDENEIRKEKRIGRKRVSFCVCLAFERFLLLLCLSSSEI